MTKPHVTTIGETQNIFIDHCASKATGRRADGRESEFCEGILDMRGNFPAQASISHVLRRCIDRGVPCAGADWTQDVVKKLGLETPLRPRDRPRKAEKGLLTR